jgi:PadR family transcriptional regulator, regulatory protein PadR
MAIKENRAELLQGTLDMMILKVLAGPAGPGASSGFGGQHGYGIVRRIQQMSDDVLQVEEGSLYPALHRLEKRGYLVADWRQSESNRRAKYYRLTPSGRAQLRTEAAAWARLSGAIEKIMNASAIADSGPVTSAGR